jgi:hypothetical protein
MLCVGAKFIPFIPAVSIEAGVEVTVSHEKYWQMPGRREPARRGERASIWKEQQPMNRARISALLTSLMLAGAATPAAAESICKPVLAVKEGRFSPAQSMERVWSASVDVDASNCASSAGRFDIEFVRIKEYAPDLPFSEQFTWHPGRLEISLAFWADEAVLAYSIGYVAPHTCRKAAPAAEVGSPASVSVQGR